MLAGNRDKLQKYKFLKSCERMLTTCKRLEWMLKAEFVTAFHGEIYSSGNVAVVHVIQGTVKHKVRIVIEIDKVKVSCIRGIV